MEKKQRFVWPRWTYLAAAIAWLGLIWYGVQEYSRITALGIFSSEKLAEMQVLWVLQGLAAASFFYSFATYHWNKNKENWNVPDTLFATAAMGSWAGLPLVVSVGSSGRIRLLWVILLLVLVSTVAYGWYKILQTNDRRNKNNG